MARFTAALSLFLRNLEIAILQLRYRRSLLSGKGYCRIYGNKRCVYDNVKAMQKLILTKLSYLQQQLAYIQVLDVFFAVGFFSVLGNIEFRHH